MSNVFRLAYNAARGTKDEPASAVETLTVFQRLARMQTQPAAAPAKPSVKAAAVAALAEAETQQRAFDLHAWRTYTKADPVSRAGMRANHGDAIERGRALDTDPEPPKAA